MVLKAKQVIDQSGCLQETSKCKQETDTTACPVELLPHLHYNRTACGRWQQRLEDRLERLRDCWNIVE